MGDTNFVFNGDDHFIMTGENAKGVKNTFKNGDKPLDLEGFLKGLENQFAGEDAPETIACSFGEPTAMGVLSDVREKALEAEAAENFDPEQASTVLERFTAMVSASGPKVRKALIAFATTTATAYIGDNPIVQGVLAAINAVQDS